MNVTIRKVRATDAAPIADIYNHYISTSCITFETREISIREMLDRITAVTAQFPFLVMECDGTVAGYCYAHLWKERAAYCRTLEVSIYLAPGQRQHGLGSRLMRQLIGELRGMGRAHSLIACITAGNSASERLFSSLGFIQVSLFKEVGIKMGKTLDVVDYQLILD